MTLLTSKDNPRVRHWKKLAEDPRYRRGEKRALIEGPHLLAAALAHGCKPVALLATQQGERDTEIRELIAKSGLRPVLLAEGVFRHIVDAENPPGVAAEIPLPAPDTKDALRSVFLEGVGRLILDPGCADPWSPKALRAGMGGHFALQIGETRNLAAEIDAFKGTVACTVPRGGSTLAEAALERSWAWIFGGEGRGLTDEIIQRADVRVTIPMAAGMESLNVAAAAAICLYEAFSRSDA